MTSAIAIKAAAVWLLILVLAVLNGTLRQAVLIPKLGAAPGLFASGVLLAGLIVAATWALLPWIGARATRQLLLIGIGWLAATLAFEFAFGLLAGKRLAEIVDAYTFKGGNLWPLVLLVTAVAPWLAAALRR